MASTTLVERLFLGGRAGQVPQDLGAAELRFQFRCRRQHLGWSDSVEDNVLQLGSSIDPHVVSAVRFVLQRLWNPERIQSGLHLWEFEPAIFARIHGGANSARRDQ